MNNRQTDVSRFARRITLSAAEDSQSRRGVATVEFAIVAPLFFLLVLGCIEFGRALMVQQMLTNASRVGHETL